jgi:hypothetical protein
MLVGVRDSTVEVLDLRGRRAVLLPRLNDPCATVRDPATLIPAMVARPRA